MKTAVSIPDPIFQSAEELAQRLGVSRSQLYAKALAAMVERHRDDAVTARLNEVYGTGQEESSLDPAVRRLQARSLPEEW